MTALTPQSRPEGHATADKQKRRRKRSGIHLTRRLRAFAVGAGFLALVSAQRAQGAGACDLNSDGSVNIVDVQLAVNMALGYSTCTANIDGSGVCNIVVVQRVVNAALGGGCVTGTHSVSLTWTASASSNVVGYNIYRGSADGGPYSLLTASPVNTTSYSDATVQSGQTYFYVATAVDSNGNESVFSTSAQAAVP